MTLPAWLVWICPVPWLHCRTPGLAGADAWLLWAPGPLWPAVGTWPTVGTWPAVAAWPAADQASGLLFKCGAQRTPVQLLQALKEVALFFAEACGHLHINAHVQRTLAARVAHVRRT